MQGVHTAAGAGGYGDVGGDDKGCGRLWRSENGESAAEVAGTMSGTLGGNTLFFHLIIATSTYFAYIDLYRRL